MEVIKELKHHPIMQDTRKNLFDGTKELRFYAQFPYFNYGFLPQTWEQNIRSEEGLMVPALLCRATTTLSTCLMSVGK